ncbi:MAG TPA: glycosyltransferase family 39 protein [Blastocatellia bacterium]|nr:glycosyltransferase family 39 protein [Blastocatellia bacterium]
MERKDDGVRQQRKSSSFNIANMKDKHWRYLSYALFLIVLIFILVTFLDYGLTADEEVQRIYGDHILSWYTSFFRDRSALSYLNLHLYGGFFEVVAQLAARIVPLGVYETRHLVNALFGLLAIVAAYKVGTYVSNPVGGFFSALFLTLTPVFYGHIFNNSKDVPFLTLFLISFYYILRSYDALPRLPKSLIARIGISVGLTMGIRIGGILLFGFIVILWACRLIFQRRLNHTSFSESVFKTILRLSLSLAFIVLIAWAAMLVFWPWAQTKPLINPFKAMSETAHFETGITVLYDGDRIEATDLPRDYLPTWFAISLPEFYFVSLLIGAFFAYWFIRGFKNDEAHFERLIKTGMLIFAFCFPPLTAIILRSTLYNGLRHFLFIIPMLAVLAGISFAALFASNANNYAKATLASLILLSAGSTVFDMARLHPYQPIYFNRLIAGGLKNAAQRYDTDYWGMTYREGAEWVINNYRPQTEEKIRVASCSTPFIARYYFDQSEEAKQRFDYVAQNENPRIFIATTKCQRKKRGNIIHTVERQGTLLLYVMELEEPE